MQYILATPHLPMSSSPASMQYLIWQHKQSKQSDRKEFEKLRQLWKDIQAEEQQKKKESKREGISKLDSNAVYERNIKWKEGIDSKLSEARERKLIEQAKQELNQSEEHQKPLLQYASTASGPVTSWESRFHNYLVNKQALPQSPTFTPVINRHSKRLVSGMVSKPVEQRLLEYGEMMKVRRDLLQEEYQKEIRGKTSKDKSVSSEISQVFWRLYKEGERGNRAKDTIKSIDENCTFMPTINEYSIETMNKISQKRKPLYNPRIPIAEKSNNQPTSSIIPEKSKSFQHFLQRNESLLTKINEVRGKKVQLVAEKQSKEINQCTFKPKINNKSIRILEERQQQSVRLMQQTMKDRQFKEAKEKRKQSEIKEMLNQEINSNQYQQERIRPQAHMLNLDFSTSKIEREPLVTTERQRQLEGSMPHHSSITLKSPRMYEQEYPHLSFSQSELHQIKQVSSFQEDSIQKMRDRQWREQLNEVEKRVMQMMNRVESNSPMN